MPRITVPIARKSVELKFLEVTFFSRSVETSENLTANIFQAPVFTESSPAFQLVLLLNSTCVETVTEFPLRSSRETQVFLQYIPAPQCQGKARHGNKRVFLSVLCFPWLFLCSQYICSMNGGKEISGLDEESDERGNKLGRDKGRKLGKNLGQRDDH